MKVAYHTDGCNYDIIPDLIEIGLDVLNPVQTECMDPAVLEDKYGDRLCFFGGIAVQSTLPYGTPEEIRKEVDWLKGTLGRGGGCSARLPIMYNWIRRWKTSSPCWMHLELRINAHADNGNNKKRYGNICTH